MMSDMATIHQPTRNVLFALDLAKEMTNLADVMEDCLTDDGCRVLYGVIRDAAEKIRKRAAQEKELHQARGEWRVEL